MINTKECFPFSGLTAGVVLAMTGCQDLSVKLPAGTLDPAHYQTAEAAEMMARGTRFIFQKYLLSYIRASGGFSDELREDQAGDPVGSFSGLPTEISSRFVPETRPLRGSGDGNKTVWPHYLGTYSGLQQIRSQALQARQSLAAYAPETPESRRGEMFLYEAYAVILLADLFCSGVPLTTVDFEGDIKVHSGATTQQLYMHAIALFDSVIALSTADPQIMGSARIGKARAALAIGRYALADTVVVPIGSGFQFGLSIMGELQPSVTNPNGFIWPEFGLYNASAVSNDAIEFKFIADSKGGNGLPYLSSRDPRILKDSVSTVSRQTNRNGLPNRFPSSRSTLVIANHIEARLIQAEVALQAGRPEWLTILNTLRTTGAFTVGTGSDTIWAAGTGDVARLRPLSDPADTAGPGTDIAVARLDLLFDERAYWLFFTGHRQGDLRRLVREYGRPIETVYPWGLYQGGTGEYGEFINLPIPDSERQYNPQFLGCQGREL